ncbi:MAG: hypothetical protein ABJN62_12715 [Halioglobus sp.]
MSVRSPEPSASATKVVMFSSVNFTRAYAGFQYLADSLHQQGFEVEVFAHVPRSLMSEARELPYTIHSCYEGFWGRIRLFRHFVFRMKIYQTVMKGCDAIVLNSSGMTGYFDVAVKFRKSKTVNALVQYCPELGLGGTKGLKGRKLEERIKSGNVPDMIVDVEPHRAEIRRNILKLKEPVYVIPNTLPLAGLPPRAPPGTLSKLAGCDFPRNKLILLFTGIASGATIRDLTEIMSFVSDNIFLLWFAHGSEKAIDSAQECLQASLGCERVHVSNSVSRTSLLSAQHEADAGLITYSWRHIRTQNQKYAAPTKLFEYLASGLPIASYGNPSILSLVEQFHIGYCSGEDTPESLARAINNLFDCNDYPELKDHVRKMFVKHLCYEKCSEVVLEKMFSLIRDESQ